MPRTRRANTVAISNQNPAVSFDQMIGDSAVKASDSKKKKSSNPSINLPEIVSKNLKEFLKQKTAMKSAENSMRQEEAVIIAHCQKIRDEKAFQGDVHSTYDVFGNNQSVKFIVTDKFSVDQSDEVLNALREAFGDKFDQVLEKKIEVKLKEEVFENEELKNELVQLIGQHFTKFFITETKWIAKKGLNDKLHSIAGTQEKLEEIRGLLPQAKPMLK